MNFSLGDFLTCHGAEWSRKLRAPQMELVLNLIWISLALLSLLGFLRSRRRSSYLTRIPHRKSLLALACGAVLLFPVVSASDDLHPTQAVMEEASKRVQLSVAPLHVMHAGLPLFMLPATLALCLMGVLVTLQRFRPVAFRLCTLDGATVPFAGRAPPFCWN
jgi:hypothetical protein